MGMSLPDIQTMVVKHHFPLKKTRAFEGMADCRSWAGRIQDEPRTFWHTREQGTSEREGELCQKDLGANL